MSREWALFIQDIIDCCVKILNFTSGMSREQFEADALHYDATVWNVIQSEIPKLTLELQRIQRECPQLFQSDSAS